MVLRFIGMGVVLMMVVMVHGYGYYTPALRRVEPLYSPERAGYFPERASAGKNLKTWITKSNL